MSGILSGLKSLGLDNLEDAELYQKDKPLPTQSGAAEQAPKAEEGDCVYDKTFICKIEGESFESKVMRMGKSRPLPAGKFLRPRYEGVDVTKYGVALCPYCGFAVLNEYLVNNKYFITPKQMEQVKANYCKKVKWTSYELNRKIYTYEEARERYQLALACAVVKGAKDSEKANICLKYSWMLQGYIESLQADPVANGDKIRELEAEEEECLRQVYEGFKLARSREDPKTMMCTIKELDMDCLLAELAIHFQEYDIAGKMVASVLQAPEANPRQKDRARDFKEIILKELKKRN